MIDKNNGLDCAENKQFSAGSSSSESERASATQRRSGPIRRAKGGWNTEEDEILRRAVELHKGRSWKRIAENFPGRTEVQCLHRWQKVLNPELIKGPWTVEEDNKIIELVAKFGPTKWSVISKSLDGRIGKQCRERWYNHLNPAIKRDAWAPEEEQLLVQAHHKYGNKWAEIAKVLPGRTDNSIKNHWNGSLKKRLHHFMSATLASAAIVNSANTAVEVTTASGEVGVKRIGSDFKGELVSDKADSHSKHNNLRAVEEDDKCNSGFSPSDSSEQKTNPSEIEPMVLSKDDAEKTVAKQQSEVVLGRQISKFGLCYKKSNSRIKSRNCYKDGESKLVQSTEDDQISLPTRNVDIPSTTMSSPNLSQHGKWDSSITINLFDTTTEEEHRNTLATPVHCIHFVVRGISDRNPEAILKEAAKSFTNTPSILRRRRRESTDSSVAMKSDYAGNNSGIVHSEGSPCTPANHIYTVTDVQPPRSSTEFMRSIETPANDGDACLPGTEPYEYCHSRTKRRVLAKSMAKNLDMVYEDATNYDALLTVFPVKENHAAIDAGQTYKNRMERN